jgi:hypothetical protein
MDGRYLFTTGRASTARKEEWVRRVIQGRLVQQAVPDHAPKQAGLYGKESRAGQYRRAQGQVGMGGRGGTYIITS